MRLSRYQKISSWRYQESPSRRAPQMRGSNMSTKDHNNTLVMLYAAIACFYSFGILAAPWIIEKNFRRPGQAPPLSYLDRSFSFPFSSGLLYSTCTGASLSAEPWRSSRRHSLFLGFGRSAFTLGGSCIVTVENRCMGYQKRLTSAIKVPYPYLGTARQ